MIKPPLITAGVVALVAGYVGYSTVYVNQAREIGQLQQQLADHQNTQQLRVQLAKSLDAVDAMQKRLAPEPSPEWVVKQLGKLAGEAGIPLASVTPAEVRSVPPFTVLAVGLEFNATYHELGRFVSAIERSETFLRIDELTIGGGIERSEARRVHLTVAGIYASPVIGAP